MSELRVVAAVTRYAGETGPVTATICAPRTAAAPRVETQALNGLDASPNVRSASGTAPATRGTSAPCLDPSQASWTIELGPLNTNSAIEFSAVFAIAGTVAGDTQSLAPREGRLIEGLWRYDLPGDGVGDLNTTDPSASPVSVPQGGRQVYALFVRSQKARPDAPIVRFATRTVSPVGSLQDISATWATATQDYKAGLADVSPSLTDNFVTPFTPPPGPDADRIAAALAWVQQRPMRPDGYQAAWHTGRKLPPVLSANDLTATDKVHLLAWVLRDAKIPFRFAMARPKAGYAPLDASFPQRDAFTTPLLAVNPPGANPLLLDPACESCQTGFTRTGLQGGQAILLPARNPTDLMDIP